MANNYNERNVPTGKALIDLCAAELFARKAEDVVLLELSSVSDVCDSFLIATCRSEAQMRAILQGLQRALRDVGIKPIGNDSGEGARWAVLDLGELMVHLFEENHRAHFSLERLYEDAPRTVLNPEDYASATANEESQDNGFI